MDVVFEHDGFIITKQPYWNTEAERLFKNEVFVGDFNDALVLGFVITELQFMQQATFVDGFHKAGAFVFVNFDCRTYNVGTYGVGFFVEGMHGFFGRLLFCIEDNKEQVLILVSVRLCGGVRFG